MPCLWFAQIDVVVIVATDHAGRHVDATDAVSRNHRFLLGQEHPLHFTGVAQLGVHLAFLLGLTVHLGIADGEGGLLGGGTEDGKVVGFEGAVGVHSRHRKHTEILAGMLERGRHHRDVVVVVDQAVREGGMAFDILDVNRCAHAQAIAKHSFIHAHP